jgi:hypothetical protein
MHFSEKHLSVFYFAFFLVMVIWSITLFSTHQTTTDWNYLFNVGSAFLFLSGGTIAFFGAKKFGINNSVGHELLSVGTGVTLFGIGLSIWSYYNLVLRVASPYPSLADVVYVFYSPILAYGLANLLRVYGVALSKKIYFEALVIFTLAATLIVTVIVPPDLSAKLPILVRALNLYYPLGDSMLITLGIMMVRLTQGKIHNSFFFFLVALFSMAAADFLFSYRTTAGTYYNGDLSDIFYALSGLMFTLGIIRIVATQLIIYKYLPKE